MMFRDISVHAVLERLLPLALDFILICLAIAALTTPAATHEVRPAYLALEEVAPGEFDVLFKTPMRGDMRLDLSVAFSGKVEALTPVVSRATGDAMVQSWRLRTNEPLAGQSVLIDGLQTTMTDALLRVSFADGSTFVERLTPASPQATIPASQSGWQVAVTYVGQGIEHILFGFDHLLFVAALLLIIRDWRVLIKTITAFTIAHSITLTLATLGYVSLPSGPVEALIALSHPARRRGGGPHAPGRDEPRRSPGRGSSPSPSGSCTGSVSPARSGQSRSAAGRHPARAVLVQCRRRGRAADLRRRDPARRARGAADLRHAQGTRSRWPPMRSGSWRRSGRFERLDAMFL